MPSISESAKGPEAQMSLPNDNLGSVMIPTIQSGSCAGQGKNPGGSSYSEGKMVSQPGLCQNELRTVLDRVETHSTHDS
jgi:hypothetical protein